MLQVLCLMHTRGSGEIMAIHGYLRCGNLGVVTKSDKLLQPLMDSQLMRQPHRATGLYLRSHTRLNIVVVVVVGVYLFL
jgi:hypothetical protein